MDSLLGEISFLCLTTELALECVVDIGANGLLFLVLVLGLRTTFCDGFKGDIWYISVGVAIMLVGVAGRSLLRILSGGSSRAF